MLDALVLIVYLHACRTAFSDCACELGPTQPGSRQLDLLPSPPPETQAWPLPVQAYTPCRQIGCYYISIAALQRCCE
jgi:hypothetical protein